MKRPTNIPSVGIGLTSPTCLAMGFVMGSSELLGLGSIGSSYLLLRFALSKREKLGPLSRRKVASTAAASSTVASASATAEGAKTTPSSGQPATLSTLVTEMLEQRRYAILLRPQIANNLTAQQLEPARSALEERMALVPDGQVRLRPGRADADNDRSALTWVQQAYLDRYPVTNREFYDFVSAGAYEQMAIWEPEIWPALFSFVDRTGCPGPKYWQNGRYAVGEEDHPVVGVSWYEATAYARWVGKRLPTDAEWVKAASWPVTLAANHVQRKYPWGEAMDLSRANLWGTGIGRTVPVSQFETGASVGGIYGLIGNVWQWTAGNFASVDADTTCGMKNIRGGAFDTYFENQATCDFASGDSPIARRHNIGFRCALPVCDLRSETTDDHQDPAVAAEAQLEEVSV